MKNVAFRPGNELSLPVPSGTKSGEPVKIGDLCGVAANDRGTGGNITGHASVDISGLVYLMDVDGAITGVGQKVYITSTRTLSTSSTSNELWGTTVCNADGTFATKSTGVGKALVKPLTV